MYAVFTACRGVLPESWYSIACNATQMLEGCLITITRHFGTFHNIWKCGSVWTPLPTINSLPQPSQPFSPLTPLLTRDLERRQSVLKLTTGLSQHDRVCSVIPWAFRCDVELWSPRGTEYHLWRHCLSTRLLVPDSPDMEPAYIKIHYYLFLSTC